jgi:hypothetical protein
MGGVGWGLLGGGWGGVGGGGLVGWSRVGGKCGVGGLAGGRVGVEMEVGSGGLPLITGTSRGRCGGPGRSSQGVQKYVPKIMKLKHNWKHSQRLCLSFLLSAAGSLSTILSCCIDSFNQESGRHPFLVGARGDGSPVVQGGFWGRQPHGIRGSGFRQHPRKRRGWGVGGRPKGQLYFRGRPLGACDAQDKMDTSRSILNVFKPGVVVHSALMVRSWIGFYFKKANRSSVAGKPFVMRHFQNAT